MRVSIGHAEVDCLSFDNALKAIVELGQGNARGQVVVTPNIQHVVLLQDNEEFREAYRKAVLVLPDGWPLVAVARASGASRCRRVTGADLLPALIGAAAREGLSVGFVGGSPGSASAAARRARLENPAVRVVVAEPAAVGFDQSRPELLGLISRVAAGQADLLFVGLGAPKQELFANRHAVALDAGVILCVGAALNFYARTSARAPMWIRRIGLEWFFRVLAEPRRLSRRYVRAAPRYVRIVGPALVRDFGKGARRV